MKIVFFGTPEYVVPILDSLHKAFKSKTGESPISAVVTQKPRPKGRKQKFSSTPVDNWARLKNIPKYYSSYELLKDNVSVDVGVLASFGEIISKEVLSIFPHGILNIHPSLLPKFRGASPIQATIVSGEKQSGATIIKLDEKLDHGPIISQFKEEVRDDDTTETLRNRLFEKSAEVITTLLPAYIKGKINPREQAHKEATFTTLLTKAHGFIPPKYLKLALRGEKAVEKWKIPFIKDYSLKPTPYTLERFIRAMQPWPVAWTEIKLKAQSEKLKVKQSLPLRGKRLKIIKAYLEDGKLVLDEVQLEGKSPVSWKQFKAGHETVIFE